MTRTEFKAYLGRRRRDGESQAAIAAELGVTQQAVSHWLTGKRIPPRSILLLAATIRAQKSSVGTAA